ncbi:hypothetical protein BAUCODRAFT_37746 [Baudoinia panamericana UAMH 10762]|uniref:MARVEL domain-containing protein n=1 Tax=Baudoinia panamericana (strain UAMH 10762) TaxID=717646 RepID=M2N2D6_BAUPA|nr:uncharacterized protein BAUCODRAFT_37746 [Baudoinia panamericana UAMH 10762]EMC92835.1 hypothetical protein BAUCODRAFT_37746 [Baudoinia panamericana UAMH 10762]
MAPVIWGLDLAEIRWGKFASKYMFGNRDYHLRRTKFVVYQCALIFCVVSESLGTAALSDYIDQQRRIQTIDHRAYVYNNDYIGAASYNIFAGVFIAFIFGAAFFFDLIWPERYESKSVRLAWQICAALSVIFHLASAVTLTIITCTRRAYITGVSAARAEYLLGQFHKDAGPQLEYGRNGRALAAVVFVWIGWVSVAASGVLLCQSIHNTVSGGGPKSRHAAGREEAHYYATTGRRQPEIVRNPSIVETGTEKETSIDDPERAQSAPSYSASPRRGDGFTNASPAADMRSAP